MAMAAFCSLIGGGPERIEFSCMLQLPKTYIVHISYFSSFSFSFLKLVTEYYGINTNILGITDNIRGRIIPLPICTHIIYFTLDPNIFFFL